MLKIKLRIVIDYAWRDPEIFHQAWEEFIGNEEVYEGMENFERITALFNEWYIFDFKLKSGMNFVTEYYLKNPDFLSKDLMEELKQIIETQRFDAFEIVEVKRGEWLKVYGLFSGKTYTIMEHSGSLNAPDGGTFYGRVANVNNHWELIGSDSIFLPLTFTQRARKTYLKSDFNVTAKDALTFFLPKENGDDLEFTKKMTNKDLKDKRKGLEEYFGQLKEKNNFKTSFDEILSFIYKENYKTNFTDFFTDLEKIGISQKMIFQEMQFFNDLWNFFPHKLLEDKCPAEIYKKAYGEKYRN